MKAISTALNICLFIMSCFLLNKEGFPKDIEGVLIFSLITLTPVINLLYTYTNKGFSSENILSLYFKRKALEEKLKIAELHKNKDGKGNV